MSALKLILLAACKEIRCARGRAGKETAEGDFVLYDHLGDGVPVTVPVTKLLMGGGDHQELRRSKVTVHFEPLGAGEEMQWDAPEKLTAQELMEELSKACSPLSEGHVVSVIVQGPGLITLSARSLISHYHVPVSVDVNQLTREQFAELMVEARTVLARSLKRASG